MLYRPGTNEVWDDLPLILRELEGQIRCLTFMDTTLPNIGERWRELYLPVHCSRVEMQRLSKQVQPAIDRKWAAQGTIDALRRAMGGLVT